MRARESAGGDSSTELAVRVKKLDLKLTQLTSTAHEAAATAGELRKRLDTRLQEKKRWERDLANLEAQRMALASADRTARKQWQESLGRLQGLTEQQTGYVDVIGRLASDNAVLRMRVAREQEVFDEVSEAWRQEREGLQSTQQQLQGELQHLRQCRTDWRALEEPDFAWLSGRADNALRSFAAAGAQSHSRGAKEFKEETRVGEALLGLRDHIVEYWHSVDGTIQQAEEDAQAARRRGRRRPAQG